MEQPKPNENPQSAADAMTRLHNLASKNQDPEKDKIAKKLLEQWEKAQEEGNSDEVIRLIGEIDKLYDGTLGKEEEKEKMPDEHAESPKTEKLSPNTSRELKENGTVIVGPLTKTFDPKRFFRQDNPKAKLVIYDGFKDEILAISKKVSQRPEAAISSFDLPMGMHDTEIRANLPKNHVFAIDDLWMIADLFENGELTNGNNLFYMQTGASILLVRIEWGTHKWHVNTWEVDGLGRWCVESRVFSRNG